ncbi:MAG: hypothetical protein F4Y12_13950 [Acidimicrobiaceae bacterium]|nr:hypothetical protein [Acidimicrobiaceae bacterium]MYH77902.1 hypothetical protein [Acidimicrobiaceae bacterium]
MRAKIAEGGLEVELVGSATEIAAVLREVLKRGGSPELPAPSALAADAESGEEGVPAPSELDSSEARDGEDHERVDALTFFRERSPTNNREATAVAAFYLAEKAPAKDRSRTITKELLGDVFREARWRLPARLGATLGDTMAAGYLNRIEAGVYELSNTGHNLVVHTLGETE